MSQQINWDWIMSMHISVFILEIQLCYLQMLAENPKKRQGVVLSVREYNRSD